MLLAIDVGNTNTVFALFYNAECRYSWRARTDAKRTADEYGVIMEQFLAMERLDRSVVADIIVGTVVPDTGFHLYKMGQRYFNCDPIIIGQADLAFDIDIDLPKPEELGADRLLNAIAAKAKYKLPCVVIDFGTATTFDILNKDGVYFGGMIAPGVNLSMDALQQAAAKLPRVPVARPEKVIGNTTISAMQSGIYWGYIGLIEGLLTRIADEMGQQTTNIVTGGLSPLFAKGSDIIHHTDVDLTLRGLYLTYEHNFISHKTERKTA